MTELLMFLFKNTCCPISMIIDKMKGFGISVVELVEDNSNYFIIKCLNDGFECLYKFTLNEKSKNKPIIDICKV